MSLTVREQIMVNRFAALSTLQKTDLNPAGLFPVVARAKASMFNAAQFPAVWMYAGKEKKHREGFLYNCKLELIFEVCVEFDNTTVETYLNTLYGALFTALAADASCGGIALKCYQGDNEFAMSVLSAAGVPDRAVIVDSWLVEYTHNAKDPTLTK